MNKEKYHVTALRQLSDQQVRFAPRDSQLRQAERAERLLSEIDPAKTYTYEYLCFRITDYRPEVAPNATMSGEDARHDLRLFVEDVTDAADVAAAEAGEPVHTVEDLSKLFNVSTKTISRWREQGLVSRRFSFDGRKRVGFLHSSVERFVASNRDRVERGEKFSQLTDEERDRIVDLAIRFARSGRSSTEVARMVATEVNRSVETVRYTIRQHDIRNPQVAVFPDHTAPLSEADRLAICEAFANGESPEVIAERYSRSRSSVHRVVNECRATKIMETSLDYIHNPEFDRPGAELEILAPMPEPETDGRKTRVPSGLPPYLTALYDVPLLNREQEYHLFRKFNFLKHRAAKLREQLDRSRPRATLLDEIEHYIDESVRTKNRIIQSNLRLVVSIAKRHVNQNDEFFTLVSDGNISLMRAAEKFDYSRGNKFSTYASWAIMKNFARTIPEEFRHRDRFRTSQDEAFVSRADERTDQVELETAQSLREQQLRRMLSKLDEREQKIIISRYGLDHSRDSRTLKEVGEEIGVTKERVRQIEARALSKLRQAAVEEHIDLPD